MGVLTPHAVADILACAQAAARGAFQPARNPGSNPNPSPDAYLEQPAEPARTSLGEEPQGPEAGPRGLAEKVSSGAERPAGGFGEAAARVAGFITGLSGNAEPGGATLSGPWEAHWEASAAALSEAVQEALSRTQVRLGSTTASSV